MSECWNLVDGQETPATRCCLVALHLAAAGPRKAFQVLEEYAKLPDIIIDVFFHT